MGTRRRKGEMASKKIEWEIYSEKKMREVEGDLNDASNEIGIDLKVLKAIEIGTGALPPGSMMTPNWIATKGKLEDAQEKIDNVNTEIGYVTEGRWVPPPSTPTGSGKWEKVKEPLTDKKIDEWVSELKEAKKDLEDARDYATGKKKVIIRISTPGEIGKAPRITGEYDTTHIDNAIAEIDKSISTLEGLKSQNSKGEQWDPEWVETWTWDPEEGYPQTDVMNPPE
jgi:hypothetical protein